MMICTRCKKRPAVVFITAMQGDEKKNEGLCILCAKELDIPQVSDYMEQMGISDSDVAALAEIMPDFEQYEEDDNTEDGDSFQPGGAETLPNFFQNFFSGGFQGFPNKADKNGELKPLSNDNATGNNDELSKPKRKDNKKDTSKDPKNKDNTKTTEKKKNFLENYCTHLTQRARDNKLDLIVGRDKEISRVIQILSRRQKNNPCLIGEPGVGKTAIAEGIAQKIVAGDVPFHIANKEVYLLDLTALVAGTQFRGQFESRVKGLIDEVKSEGNIILFIDEVHNLVGTGDSEGTMNAANILKPALSRGEVQVIGATTFKEYRKYIEKDSALERRFQPVTINEPTVEDTVAVLMGIRHYYQLHHRVKITDEAIRMCAVLSERYINDRFLPDKAIDLLDEACACASIRSPELAEYEKLNSALKPLLDEEISISEEEQIHDYERLATVKAELIRIKERLVQVESTMQNIMVTDDDLSKVIELWTGIPANKIIETEYVKLNNLEDRLKLRIIGQDAAVELVAKAIKRTRVQLTKRRRPASFIFVGPTGVGKTELVKVLASELFDSTEPLIRLDMTEYMEKHSVARIIGSPPGYVGYDDAGQLTEKVRRKPYSVVLFDEIEKAHPDVMNILLQILDEGRVNDAQGRNISFENTVIAMTSNAGSTDKVTGVGFNKTTQEISSEKAMKGLSDFLRPEFLSRVDEVVTFKPLAFDDFKRIAALMLDEMKEPLMEKKVTFLYDDLALTKIANKSFGGKFGARDIRKIIRRDVEDKITSIIINQTGLSSIKLTANEELEVLPI